MPRGSHYEETGWLNDDAGKWVLRCDGGGRWRLDCGPIVRWGSRKLIGRRVRIIGERDDFDWLAVWTIDPLRVP